MQISQEINQGKECGLWGVSRLGQLFILLWKQEFPLREG